MAAPKDEKLEYLLEQTAKICYEGFGEPEIDVEGISEKLYEAAKNRVSEALRRLGLDASLKFNLYFNEPIGSVISEVQTDSDYPISFSISVCQHGRMFNPTICIIELSVKGDCRPYFDAVIRDYPRLLQDFLENNRAAIEFMCHVGLEDEKSITGKATDWVKAYLKNYDPEEEFFLQYEVKQNTSLQTIEYVMISLIAIYDAATAYFDGQPDELIRHHLKIFKGKQTRKPEPAIGFIIEYKSTWRDLLQYYHIEALDEEQAEIKFKRRYRSFMDDSKDTILRTISQKSDRAIFQKLLPECENYYG